MDYFKLAQGICRPNRVIREISEREYKARRLVFVLWKEVVRLRKLVRDLKQDGSGTKFDS